MPVSDLCKKRVVTIDKTCTLAEAAQSMKRNRVGFLVVQELNAEKALLGVITDRDIAVKGTGENRPPDSLVTEIMSRNLVMISESAGLGAALEQMTRAKVRRLLVMDQDNLVLGIVTADDFIRLVAKELNSLSSILRDQVEDELDQAYWDQVIL